MTLAECFEKIGGDYAGVMGRLLSEERVIKFIKKFPENDLLTPIQESIASADYEACFRASHNLKGVSQNLGLARLADSAHTLTELCRDGKPETDPTPVFKQLETDYNLTLEAIRELD